MDNLAINSFAIGSGSKDKNGNWLEFFYYKPKTQLDDETLARIKSILPSTSSEQKLDANQSWLNDLSEFIDSKQLYPSATISQLVEQKYRQPVVILLDDDRAELNVASAYLKLHLLSHRLYKPNQLNLDDLFKVLPNVAWTNEGAIAVDEINERLWQAKIEGKQLMVKSVDKMPAMCDYVVPSKVRIANSAKVRLGAYIGAGTTIMHAGFVNFNAGCEGPNMIEGRMSAGVWMKKGSDIGGGASTMGRLSGGGNVLVSIGENSLLGANAGLGIPLGSNCTIESGLYITAGSKIKLITADGENIVKAAQLAFTDNLLFRRNSISGGIECIPNNNKISLNELLHSHN